MHFKKLSILRKYSESMAVFVTFGFLAAPNHLAWSDTGKKKTQEFPLVLVKDYSEKALCEALKILNSGRIQDARNYWANQKRIATSIEAKGTIEWDILAMGDALIEQDLGRGTLALEAFEKKPFPAKLRALLRPQEALLLVEIEKMRKTVPRGYLNFAATPQTCLWKIQSQEALTQKLWSVLASQTLAVTLDCRSPSFSKVKMFNVGPGKTINIDAESFLTPDELKIYNSQIAPASSVTNLSKKDSINKTESTESLWLTHLNLGLNGGILALKNNRKEKKYFGLGNKENLFSLVGVSFSSKIFRVGLDLAMADAQYASTQISGMALDESEAWLIPSVSAGYEFDTDLNVSIFPYIGTCFLPLNDIPWQILTGQKLSFIITEKFDAVAEAGQFFEVNEKKTKLEFARYSLSMGIAYKFDAQ